MSFAIHYCPNLIYINISYSGVGNDSVLAIIHNCIELRHIYMIHCKNLTDDCFFNINSYKLKLKTINLNDCYEITERGIHSMIEKCPDLKYIRTDIEINHAQFEKKIMNLLKLISNQIIINIYKKIK